MKPIHWQKSNNKTQKSVKYSVINYGMSTVAAAGILGRGTKVGAAMVIYGVWLRKSTAF